MRYFINYTFWLIKMESNPSNPDPRDCQHHERPITHLNLTTDQVLCYMCKRDPGDEVVDQVDYCNEKYRDWMETFGILTVLIERKEKLPREKNSLYTYLKDLTDP